MTFHYRIYIQNIKPNERISIIINNVYFIHSGDGPLGKLAKRYRLISGDIIYIYPVMKSPLDLNFHFSTEYFYKTQICHA